MNIDINNKTDDNLLIFDVNEKDFTTKVIEVSETRPVLVDFWAPWCGPCKQLSPILEEIIQDAQGSVILAKINIDENQQIASQLRIQSIPTVIAFNKKKIVDAFQGVLSKKQIIEFIEKVSGAPMQKDNSEFYNRVSDLISNQELDRAKNFLEEFLVENSNETKAIALYIKCLTELKTFDELERFIESLEKNIVANQVVQSAISNYKMFKATSNEPSLDKLIANYNTHPNNVKNIIKLSDKYFVEKNTEEAFNLLLDNFLIFKENEKEKIKKTLLKYFDVLGNEHEQTKIYRRKLSSILFS